MTRIEDYALIGDCESAALVGMDGSIDWLCWPRFDSPACFAALLGRAEHGRWCIAPRDGATSTRRRYRDGTLILETEFETESGSATLIDFMAMDGVGNVPTLVRVVRGTRGRVEMASEWVPRFGYGAVVPALRMLDRASVGATSSTNLLMIQSEAPLRIDGSTVASTFDVVAGARVDFTLQYRSTVATPSTIDVDALLTSTEASWRSWGGQNAAGGSYRDAVETSLLTLKALTQRSTGGMVAAPTTSLPQRLGGVRNWDYRYCWLRDSALAADALLQAGHTEEVRDWCEWILRTTGEVEGAQPVYGLAGEHELGERELPFLSGYEGARPVRVGNAAYRQVQLDPWGSVMHAVWEARRAGLPSSGPLMSFAQAVIVHVEATWRSPDHGLWEVRGPPQHFTHSKVMAWTAIDRAIRLAEGAGVPAPAERWRALRDTVHADVCRHAYDAALGTFVQAYGSTHLDANLLILPLVGFLPATDERVRRTVEAIERNLMREGLLLRYDPAVDDGLPPGQGAFLACSFWLVECLVLLGRTSDAVALFERLLDLRNDVGLLAEQYDIDANRLTGNFPLGFSHAALLGAARRIAAAPSA